MKKISLKNKKNFKIETRAWLPGDLVKIKPSTWSGRAGESLAVVLHEVKDKDSPLFPSVIVYHMSTGIPCQFYLYDLELISAVL